MLKLPEYKPQILGKQGFQNFMLNLPEYKPQILGKQGFQNVMYLRVQTLDCWKTRFPKFHIALPRFLENKASKDLMLL